MPHSPADFQQAYRNKHLAGEWFEDINYTAKFILCAYQLYLHAKHIL